MTRAGKRAPRSLSAQAAALDLRKRPAPATTPEESAARVQVLGRAATRLTAPPTPPRPGPRRRKRT